MNEMSFVRDVAPHLACSVESGGKKKNISLIHQHSQTFQKIIFKVPKPLLLRNALVVWIWGGKLDFSRAYEFKWTWPAYTVCLREVVHHMTPFYLYVSHDVVQSVFKHDKGVVQHRDVHCLLSLSLSAPPPAMQIYSPMIAGAAKGCLLYKHWSVGFLTIIKCIVPVNSCKEYNRL